MNLVKENIDNLTSMWRLVNEKMKAHHMESEYEFGVLTYSQWPNRLWFNGDITKNGLKKARTVIQNSSTKLIIPYWDIYKSQSHEFLEKSGFEKKGQQIGMSLKLDSSYRSVSTMTFDKVGNEIKAKLWEQLFTQAFNYKIDQRVIRENQYDLEFLIANHNNEPVGSVLLHPSGENIMGIHSMGIIPEKRRKGLAEQMMINILSQSAEQGIRYAMLQASELGKRLYLKLGFSEQFIIRNYGLK